MECPKCGLEIDDNAVVCPNCKKVLKVVCPICKTVNKTNTCKKCGYVVISKCNKCGKVNQTIKGKCPKCGTDTEKSVILNEANTDDYTLLTIDFPNMDEMRVLLGSNKLLTKFKANLDKIIDDLVHSVGIRRQIIDNTYVIRFYKDYTFTSSAQSAVDSAVQILTEITKMNYKLTKKKNASVRCNMTLLKRTVEDNPRDYKSGLNINMLNQETDKEAKLMGTFQIITDSAVKDILEKKYKLEALNSVMIDGEMVMFYEMDVKDLIKIDYSQLEEKEDDDIKIPNFVQNMLVEQDKLDGIALNNLEQPSDPDAIYDIETIDFNEINCDFIRTENIDVFYHVVNRLQSVPKGILAIKTAQMYVPYSLKIISTIEELHIFNNIISITCYDEMKYSPYSFFRDLLAAIFEYTVSQKLFSQNDFSMFANIDPDNMIKDLITFKERDISNPEDTRYTYFDIFLTLLQAIPKTLIFIENFEKIDASSYDVLKYLFEAFDDLDVSYLISYDREFSLHKDSHFLLTKPYYTEINLKPTPFERMIEENKHYYRNVMDSFYFHRIAKYACGSILYLDVAIQYLIEAGVYSAGEDSIELVSPKTIIIPSNLSKLMKRRFDILKDEPECLKFLASCILMGTRIDEATINSLKYENTEEIIKKLSGMGYIYYYNNCLYFPNYNLLRENLIEVMDKKLLKEIAANLFANVFIEEMPSPVKAYLYSLIKEDKKEFKEWEDLARINLSMGDFSAYLNCANKILNLLDKIFDEEEQEFVENYKLQLYENISTNLYEYVPEDTFDIAEITLQNLEKTTNIDKIVLLCNKMIQGCLVVGNFTHALELTHKVLSLIPTASIDPQSPNFNTYFFLMSLVHIEILFSIGAFEDCIDIGYKVLSVVSDKTLDVLRPDYYSPEHFEEIIVDSIGYVALANVLQLKGNVAEFLEITRKDLTMVPKSYDIFVMLQDLIAGKEMNFENVQISANDKFAGVIKHIISAFVNVSDDAKDFAEEIYIAKIASKESKIHQLELFCDLMIGAAYLKLESYKKASAIIYKIIKAANNNGMTSLLYIAWFLMSELKLKQGKYDVAFGIVNNSLIQLERSNTASEYILLLFKYNMFKVLMFKQQFDKAEICLAHASYIATKFHLNFEFDTNPENYIPIEDPDMAFISEPPPGTIKTVEDDNNENIEEIETAKEMEE